MKHNWKKGTLVSYEDRGDILRIKTGNGRIIKASLYGVNLKGFGGKGLRMARHYIRSMMPQGHEIEYDIVDRDKQKAHINVKYQKHIINYQYNRFLRTLSGV